MYGHTKKVGSLGRYGPRVGRKIRHEVKKIEDDSRRDRQCPACNRKRVKRLSAGVWYCKSCRLKFTGGTHIPTVSKKIELEQ
jgi:large subunit ribosomal protein L37Ae